VLVLFTDTFDIQIINEESRGLNTGVFPDVTTCIAYNPLPRS